MYRLTTIKGLINHQGVKVMLMVFAIAAFISLSALPATAQGEGGLQLEMSLSLRSALYGDSTVVHAGSIGLVPGQTVSVRVPNFQFSDGSVTFVKHSLKVYEVQPGGVTENESGLIYSGESGGMNESGHEFGHVFTFRHEHLRVAGEPGTRRIQVWIVVESLLPSPMPERTEDPSVVALQPTFELIDEGSGKTVVFGLLLPAITKVEGEPFNPFGSFQGGVSVGMAKGQTVRIVFRSTTDAPASSFGGHVKAFNAATGALLWSRELTNSAGLHTIDINRDELPEAGNSDTARVELWIEVSVGMEVSLPTFELRDNESGKTTVREAAGPMKESMETMKKAWK